MRLLIVEDEARMSRVLRRGLTEDGHVVDVCESAAAAHESIRHIDYDVVMLDWGLPDQDGISLLRAWREEGIHTPVLMLSARGTSGERVLGLKSGADDYLVKPFDFEELLARLEALHRRAGGEPSVDALGDVRFFRTRRELSGPSGTAELTTREFQLLTALWEKRGDVRTRSELLSGVWGHNFDGNPNVIDVYVGYLRNKLTQVGSQHLRIETIRGTGYRLRATSPSDS